MKTVYFVRHGQSTINDDSSLVFQGAEAPLNPLGEQQARRVAERIRELRPEALIASTMLRAVQTAAPIAEATGLEMETTALFTERVAPSSYIGLPLDNPETKLLTRDWMRSFFHEDVRVLDGENFEDMKERARQALEFLLQRPEERIVVVTHGFFMRMILASILFHEHVTPKLFQQLAERTRTMYTGITILKHGSAEGSRLDRDGYDGWLAHTWNDFGHLA